MYQTLKRSMDAMHRLIASAAWSAKLYLGALSLLSRTLRSQRISAHLQSAINRIHWPLLHFAPRVVRVGGVEFSLIPHLGEFDQVALFSREFTYEPELTSWLVENVQHFDTIIEIGANVGAHSVLISKCLSASATLYCFEPSPEAAMRLRANLAGNAARAVHHFEVAVAATSGFLSFHCPRGHLTNGSLRHDFAAIFSDSVESIKVPSLAAQALAELMQGRVLLKIDVEGCEPMLLSAFGELLAQRRVTLIVEVLPGTDAFLNDHGVLLSHTAWHLSASGPIQSERVFADEHARDWLFVPR